MRPFDKCGKTILVASDSTAPLGVQCPTSGVHKKCQYRIHNAGSVLVHVAYGDSAANAQSAAVAATGGGASSKDSIPIPAGAIEVFSAPPETYFSSYSASAASVYITPGEGL